MIIIRWLMVCRRCSAKPVTVAATNSRGISCSSIRIVEVARYVGGQLKAAIAAAKNTSTAGITRLHLRRRMIAA